MTGSEFNSKIFEVAATCSTFVPTCFRDYTVFWRPSGLILVSPSFVIDDWQQLVASASFRLFRRVMQSRHSCLCYWVILPLPLLSCAWYLQALVPPVWPENKIIVVCENDASSKPFLACLGIRWLGLISFSLSAYQYIRKILAISKMPTKVLFLFPFPAYSLSTPKVCLFQPVMLFMFT